MRRFEIEKADAFVEWLYRRRGIVALLLLALSVATCIIFFGAQTGDSARYLILANNISQGNGFSAGTSAPYYPEVFRPPLYPYFLAFSTKLGVGIYGVAVIQSGLYFLTVLLAGKIALALTHDRLVALSATLIPAAYLPIIRWTVAITTESICAFLFCSACLCYLYFLTAPAWKNTIALSLFLTGLFLTRPTYFVLFPIIAIIGALYHYRGGRLKYSIALIALLGLATLSWGWRNITALSGAFQPFGVGSGMALFVGAAEIQERDIARRDALVLNHPDFLTVHSGSNPSQMLESDRRLKQAAMDTIRVRWRDYAKRTVFLIVLRQWIEAFDPRLPRALLAFVAAISSSLAVLAYVGIFVVGKNNLAALSLGMLCFAISISHALFANEARYTAPVRPILYIFSSVAVVHLIRKLRKRLEGNG
jgi:4-amino-4-deoxy-L-arabinose transferase-like glycosyltransferase